MPVISPQSRRWLGAARAAWLGYTLLVSVIFVLGAIARFEEMTRQDVYHFGALLKQLGLSLEFFAIYTTTLDLLTAAAFVSIGMVVFWRVRNDWMGLISSLTNVSVIMGLLPWIPTNLISGTIWYPAAIFLRGFGFFTAILFFYIFPDGHFTPGWTRLFTVLLGLYAVSWLFFPSLMPPTDFAAINVLDKVPALILALVFMASGVVAQVVRYRSNTDAIRRQQTRWVLFGCLAVLVSFVIASLPVLLFPEVRVPGLPNLVFLLAIIPLLIISLLMLPVSMAVSIMRYRLWDIDLIIRRTLVYGMLSAVLAVVYLASVVILQQALRFVIGANTGMAVAVSTLGIAALFTPLRNRIQVFIDRRFYRQKYDAERALEEFNAAARSEVEIKNLTARMVSVVEKTVNPEKIWVWIRDVPRRTHKS